MRVQMTPTTIAAVTKKQVTVNSTPPATATTIVRGPVNAGPVISGVGRTIMRIPAGNMKPIQMASAPVPLAITVGGGVKLPTVSGAQLRTVASTVMLNPQKAGGASGSGSHVGPIRHANHITVTKANAPSTTTALVAASQPQQQKQQQQHSAVKGNKPKSLNILLEHNYA